MTDPGTYIFQQGINFICRKFLTCFYLAHLPSPLTSLNPHAPGGAQYYHENVLQ
ncbi:hypothetical protein J2S03_002907 [Alicyclobacillus cycloheptanicus]|uniref:Uncharacterized protein n=1 Tax=Alicyclobacillus cycloheptanicus TaxID=1457 RepID=A0ABT9XL49_9BACL|nr:hypothetical protein [Alicyclobacillus cycloheptanicus]